MQAIDECWRQVSEEFLGPEVAQRLISLVQEQCTDPASDDFTARVDAYAYRQEQAEEG